MHAYLNAMALALGLAMLLSLYRVVRGPTHFDRLIGLGLIGTKTVVLLVLMGSLTHKADMLVDLALTYALVGFIGTLGLAKFFESRRNLKV
ncbi:MAG: monovalent cation/H+ antiporter complex subunit F [Elusimicrobiota bacterium]